MRPYSSAKDPVNIAGFTAANILKGDVDQILWDRLPELDPEKDVLIDLRNPAELNKKVPYGSAPYSSSRLRKRLAELDRKKRYVCCAAGLRSYIGHRILIQRGFRSISLAGGFRIFKGVRKKIEPSMKTASHSQQ